MVTRDWNNRETRYCVFRDGLAAVQKDEKWGFINTKGELVIPCEWDDASCFNDGYARVEENGERGFIDTTGKLVNSFDWDDAYYGEGYYIAGKDDYLFIYDASGKQVF